MKRKSFLFHWAVLALTMATVALAHAGPPTTTTDTTITMTISDFGNGGNPATSAAPIDIGRVGSDPHYVTNSNYTRGAPDLGTNDITNDCDDRRIRIDVGDSQRR